MVRAGTVVILAAGQGTRMRSSLPKVLHELCGRPMLGYVLDQARALEPERVLVVTGHREELVRGWVDGAGRDEAGGARIGFVHQAEQLGTGHALLVCLEELREAPGPVVVLYGDMPLLSAPTLRGLVEARGKAAASMLSVIAPEPRGFGRILRDNARGGRFLGIVEERDASEEERAIREVNVGVYCFEREALLERLPQLSSDNAQGEYYLTDVLGSIVADGGSVELVGVEDEREAIGINDLAQLAEARAVLQGRILAEHMAAGVYVEDPATTYVDHGVRIGAGARILPCSVIRRGAQVREGTQVGPFAHLGPAGIVSASRVVDGDAGGTSSDGATT